MNEPKDRAYKAMRRLYKNYVRDCRRFNNFWGLTLEEFHTLTSSNCVYCGKIPAQRRQEYIYNGIDRKDPKKGYHPDNCVSCCKECNFIKGNRLTEEEMKIIGAALSQHRRNKTTPDPSS